VNVSLEKTAAGVVAYGTVTAAGVETINISSDDEVAAGSAAAVDTLTLASTSATSIVVTGNNGLDLTNLNNVLVTSFDASGVVANGTATVDTAANLGVTFVSANATAAAAVTIKGGAGEDVLKGSAAEINVDTITGGAGADKITGGTGADIIDVTAEAGVVDQIILAAGDTGLTISGTGNTGTITGFDVVTGMAAGDGTNNSDHVNTIGTAALLADGKTNGTDSTLTIGSFTIASHSVADGVITFDDANTYATALVVSTASDVAAVVQYLQLNDLGTTGSTVIFDVGSDNYLYTQGTGAGDNAALDVLVKLVGVQADALITSNASGLNDLFIS